MLTKELKKYIASPQKRKAKRGRSFFELASRHMIKSGPENRNLSQEVDKIVYGIDRNGNTL